MQIIRKGTNKIESSYKREWSSKIRIPFKNLGVTFIHDLRWNTCISKVSSKANRTLVFPQRNLYQCPQEVKEAAFWTCSPGFGISKLWFFKNKSKKFIIGLPGL